MPLNTTRDYDSDDICECGHPLEQHELTPIGGGLFSADDCELCECGVYRAF